MILLLATYFDADVETVVGIFKTSIAQGLTDNEVIARREHYGQNLLPKPKKKSIWVSQIMPKNFRKTCELLTVLLISECYGTKCATL